MHSLIIGVLHDTPTTKTGKTGTAYCIGKIRDDSTEPPAWVSIICFDKHAETLAGCCKGESVSVSGKLTAGVFTPTGGEPRINLSLACDNIMTMKPAKKPKSTGSSYKKSNGSNSSGFNVAKFKQDSGYKPQAAPRPPENGDPF